MWFIGKKKKNEEDEEELEDKKPKRTRKKKEEPPKPWGKKERLLVFSVLFITAVGASLQALSARSWKLPGLPEIEIPELSLEKTYVFESEGEPEQATEIKDLIKSKTRNLSGLYGVYVYRLNRNEFYGVNENKIFQAASLIKLPVLVALYQEVEKGNIDLEDIYTLKDGDKIGGAGSLYDREEGEKFTYRELARLMANESDNTAFNIVRRKLGDERIDRTIELIGMQKTSISENETTPSDIGILLRKAWNAKIISKENSRELFENLTNTVYEDHLPAGIPNGIRVSHKYGREVHVVNDAGIVYSEKEPAVIVLMSDGIVEPEADKVIPEIARLIYEYESL